RHAAHDRRAKIIRPAGVPVHDPADVGERAIGHDRAALVLDAIEQPRNVAAANGIDRLLPDPGINEPLERALAVAYRPQFLALACEILLGDRFERILGQRAPGAALLQRVAVFRDLAKQSTRVLASGGKAEHTVDGHAPAAAVRPVLHDEAAMSRGAHNEAEARQLGVPEQRPPRAWLSARLLDQRRRQLCPHWRPCQNVTRSLQVSTW